MNNYNIYSGFCRSVDPVKYGDLNADSWFNIWFNNTIKLSNCMVYIIGPEKPNTDLDDKTVRILGEYDNLGHVGDYIHGYRKGLWCGWTAGIVFGMMHAYVNNVDFLYKEQDCLWFGDNIINQIYSDLGSADIVFGSSKLMNVGQSLFLVKRDAIPSIIANLAQNPDHIILPETKFLNLPNHSRLSFGYDRDRPFNVRDNNFYIQQISGAELNQLISLSLI